MNVLVSDLHIKSYLLVEKNKKAFLETDDTDDNVAIIPHECFIT